MILIMKKIYLIDASSFIYRMFYWIPEMKTKNWQIVNAIYWIAKFFLMQIQIENPDYLIFVKDAKWKNFRHKLYENYKATRDKMPDNLKSQIPIIYDMIEKIWIPSIEVQGYEADDIIWTLAKKYDWNLEYKIYILSWDKDLFSLVSDNIWIYDTMKKKKFGVKETIEKFWINPDKIIDYLAIVWDKADNIPWIEWFGPKKAVDLINIIWWIRDIYDFIEKNNFKNLSDKEKKEILEKNFWEEKAKKIFSIFKWKTFEKLINSKENAFLSKKLATIELNVNLQDFNLEKYKYSSQNYLNPEIKTLFKKLEFHSLLWEEDPKLKKWEDLGLSVKFINNDKKLDNLFNLIKNFPQIVLDTETTGLDIIKAELVWISIYLNDDNIFYINRLHSWDKVSDQELKVFLKNLFNLDITIIGHNIKYDLEIIDLFLKSKNTEKETNNNEQISIF